MKYFNGLIIFSVLAILFPLNGNSNGLKDRTEYQYLDSIVYCASKNEQLENRTKLFFEYDEFNRLASCIGYQWEESTFEWKNHSKRNYTYNEIGRNIRVDEFTWNVEVENWLFKNRKDSLISSTGNLEEVVEYLWDTSENKFLEISHIWFNGNEQDTLFISGTLKKINRYNGDNLQYSSSYRKDTPDVWNLISKIEYEYDDSNLLTTEKLFTRTESDSLELQEKTLYGHL